MNRNPIVYLLSLTLCFVFFTSCSEEVDFEQAKNLTLEPVYEIDFVFASISPPNLTDPISQQIEPVLRDTLNYDLFGENTGEKYIQRVELLFEFENSIGSETEVNLDFLDPDDQVLHTVRITIPGGNVNNVTNFEHIEIFDRELIEQLNGVDRLATEVRLTNSTVPPGGRLKVKSKGTYFAEIDL